MLNWWFGRVAANGSHGQGDDSNQEPPETPAPLFAARALRSAIFGTPAPADDNEDFEIDSIIGAMDRRDARRSQGNMSPSKPPGILMTPGTAGGRQKTVSWGEDVDDKKAARGNGATPIPPGAYPLSAPRNKTSLTKALEDARGPKLSNGELSKKADQGTEVLPSQQINSEKERDPVKRRSASVESRVATATGTNSRVPTDKDNEQDVTVDLNEPRSQSGKHWKAEFEAFHDEAKQKIDDLGKHKQIARNYVKRQEAESMQLRDKLKAEQRHVVMLENRLSKLSKFVATADFQGGADDKSPELIQELARQTAIAIEYKTQVEEFKMALEEQEGKRQMRPAQSDPETITVSRRSFEKIDAQLKEFHARQKELKQLREASTTADDLMMKVHEQNVLLQEKLRLAELQIKQLDTGTGKPPKTLEEELKKKDEECQKAQRDYSDMKNLAKTKALEAQKLLVHYRDQVTDLRKQVESQKSVEKTVRDLQIAMKEKDQEHEKVVARYEQDLASLRNVVAQTEAVESKQSPARRILNESPRSRESYIPVASNSVSRPSKIMDAAKNGSETPSGSPARPLPSRLALSEVVNNSSAERFPSEPSQLVKATPVVPRVSHTHFDDSDMDSTVPEPTLPRNAGRAIHQRNCGVSPRPSMFNLASSPPKPAIARARSINDLSRPNPLARARQEAQGHIPSDGTTATEDREKRILHPDRRAAAIARLAQKNAEKKRAQSLASGKENSLE